MKTKRVDALRLGDMVDLQGDKHADPNGDHPEYEFEYVSVIGTERETPGCVRVDFSDGGSRGFPPGHELKLAE